VESEHNTIKISIIISTYNAEVWLEKVLWGFHVQSFKDFEVVIADDGSGPATRALLERLKHEVSFQILHVWQEDDGFQKSRILNKAIMASRSDYIIMTDGDCIPREDFVMVHYLNRKPGCFISGGYFMLPMNVSLAIEKDDILSQRCFRIDWLRDQGIPRTFKNNKLTAKGRLSKLLNRLTPTRASWNGHNSSGWKKDILEVNGFDERMQYGGQDRELGERLVNFGIKPLQFRYSAICIHLDHKRGYKTPETLTKNARIRRETRRQKKVWTPFGIIKKSAP
jgi:glycosyltransferase involved in cell wall biosynthesis